MKRLLIVQDHLRHGGTESHSVWLAGALRRKGFETAILTFRPGGPLESRAMQAGVPVSSLQESDTRLDWYTPGLDARLRELSPEAVLLMGRMANARAGFVRISLPDTKLVGAWRSGRPMPWYVRRALRKCDAVVSNARSVAAALPVDPEKVVVIPNPPVMPPLAVDPAVRAKIRSDLGARPDVPVLLCVAAFRPGKGQDELIRTLALIPAPERPWLWLAGDGETRASCEALATSSGVSGRVRFLGHTADPRPLYLAADLAVMASAAEALPNFLVEAQLHGLPVAAWEAGGVGETFVPGASGVLTPHGDKAALAAAWRDLLQSPSILADYGAKALAWAPGVFSEESAVATYRRVFFKG